MTDYTDGKWHGWNGGECPVDPDSEIEAVFHDDSSDNRPLGWHSDRIVRAGRISPQCWLYSAGYRQIIAFRVTKSAPPKPREWWIIAEIAPFRSKEAAESWSKRFPEDGKAVHVREVLE